MDAIKVAILVVSETASKDPSTDKSTETLTSVFESPSASNVEWKVVATKIVLDEINAIQSAVFAWQNVVDLVITTGGTGFTVKDVTPEAIRPLLTKEAPGIVHAMLASSLAITPFAMMSRPVAGVRDATLIVTLPGSPKGAKENLEAIIKFLPHACVQAKGGDSRAIHSGGVKKLEKDAGVVQAVSTALSQSHSHSHSHGFHGHGHGGHQGPTPHTTQSNRGHSNEIHGSVTTRHRSSPYPMLSVKDANAIISQNTPTGALVEMPVDPSLVGYILAEDVTAAESVPAYRASIVDGYAVVHTDGKGVYPVVSVSHAAPGESTILKSGQIARITTGAPLPEGTTAVVMVEDTVLKSTTHDGKEELEIEILADGMKDGENVREVGSDIMSGDIVLQKGSEITAVGGEIGILASVGRAMVKVYKKPIVGVLSTGDEVVEHNRLEILKRGEIRDSNRPVLMAVIKAWGYQVVDLGIVNDRPESLQEILTEAIGKCDVIVTTGGVSMGELDLLKPTIERSLDGTIHFGRVAMKPGKPTTFATVEQVPNILTPVPTASRRRRASAANGLEEPDMPALAKFRREKLSPRAQQLMEDHMRAYRDEIFERLYTEAQRSEKSPKVIFEDVDMYVVIANWANIHAVKELCPFLGWSKELSARYGFTLYTALHEIAITNDPSAKAAVDEREILLGASKQASKKTLIFSLPGNPASATVTFHLFVLPSLRQAAGHAPPNHHLPRALVSVTHDIPLDSRPEYHRANVVVGKNGGLEATSTGGQRSSRIGSMATANALLCLPATEEVGDKRTRIPGGDRVEAIIIGRLG